MKMFRLPHCFARVLGVFIILLSWIPNFAVASEKLTKAGWIERAHINSGELVIKAKLDTGAQTSSLHAEDITRFERDGKPWVKFTVKDQDEKTYTLEREIQRIVKIKRHNLEPAERPVVILDVCLGTTHKHTEVNLIDRSQYKYSFLIGRTFLDEHFMIDPSSKYLLQTHCEVRPAE